MTRGAFVDVDRRSGAGERHARSGGLSNNTLLSFVPWVIFWVVAGPRSWELGVGCALIFVVMAILGAIAKTGIAGAGSSDWLNWYIPIALIVLGMKFNEWYPAQVRRTVGGHG